MIFSSRITIPATLIFLLLGSLCRVWAMPPSPEVVEHYRESDQLDVLSEKLRLVERTSEPLAEDFVPLPLAKRTAGDTLRLRIPVLLVDFSDNAASDGMVSGKTAGDFEQLLFSRQMTTYGSLTDFYLENSYGNMLVEGDVIGWIHMPQTYAAYRGSEYGTQSITPNAQTMARDAVIAADSWVDFSQYDSDGDGFVDGIFIVHAGPGAETIPPPNDTLHIWSHAWYIPGGYMTNDGVRVFRYTTEPEEIGSNMVSIGVFCHEFGHTLGLPDLYDISYLSEGIGNWGIMGGGGWNGGGRYPAHFGAWSKYFLDAHYDVFGRTIEVTANMTGVTLGPATEDSTRYRITLPGTSGREYFLIENRRQEEFDRGIPGSGLLIWHCDDNLSGSNDLEHNDHLRIAIEQADGLFQLESGYNGGDANDVFPGSQGIFIEFTDLSLPSTASNQGITNQISVWDIDHDAYTGVVNCTMDISYSRANVQVHDLTFSDQTYGDGDGVLEGGETIEVAYVIESYWLDPAQVEVTLNTSADGVFFESNQRSYPLLTRGIVYSNAADPFKFTLSPDVDPSISEFELGITSGTPNGSFGTSLYVNLGGSDLLLVDDDADQLNGRGDRSQYYLDALNELMIPYTYWNVDQSGVPTAAEYAFEKIVWFTGDAGSTHLSHDEVLFLRGFLDQGGSLFLTGQDIAEGLSSGSDSLFLRDHLKCRYLGSTVDLTVLGASGNELGEGMRMQIIGYDGAQNQTSADELSPAWEAAGIAFEYLISRKPAAVTYSASGQYRLVFFGFGFEGIRSHLSDYNGRTEVMSEVLDFLDDHTATAVDFDQTDIRLPSGFALNQNYPNPFNPTTVISFTIAPEFASKPLSLDIYDVLGRHVESLLTGMAAPGLHRVEFKADALASGVYFYRLRVGEQSETRKMLLVR